MKLKKIGLFQLFSLVGLIVQSLCVIIVLSGCSIINLGGKPTLSPKTIKDVVVHSSFSEETKIMKWSIEEGGNQVQSTSQIGLGFIRLEDRNTPPNQLPQNDEFHIKSGEPLELVLILNSAQSKTFLVTAIIDYQQVNFYVDEKYGLLHEVFVESGGDLYVPIKININGEGAHDIIIAAFEEPYNRSWNQAIRETCQLAGRRAIVIVDNVEKPFRETKPDIYGVAPPPEIDFGVRLLFADEPKSLLGNTHPSQRQMKMTKHVKSGDVFRYQLWLSNYDQPDDEVDYGLMRFLDYHQVDFNQKDLYIVHFDGRQEVIIDDSIILPLKEGVHELQILYLFDPNKSLLKNEVLAPFVFTSSCLGLNVR